MDIFYPLRIVRGKLHRWKLTYEKKKKYRRLKKGRAFLIGTPEHINIGDSAIVLAERTVLYSYLPQERIKEISYNDYLRDGEIIRKYIPGKRPIFLHGGGNMGDTWSNEEAMRRRILTDLSQNNKLIFPQTIHYSETAEGELSKKQSLTFYDNHDNLTLAAREKTSFALMQKYYPHAKILLAPDIVLSTTMKDYGAEMQERKGVLFCVRSDEEKAVPESVWSDLENFISAQGRSAARTDMYSDCKVTKETRRECVRKKMQEFCGAELVITDRLHGMIFAAITGTPCVVFSNYNHKVKGTYDWISYLPYIRYVNTAEEAKAAIPELLPMRGCQFDNAPLQPYFDKLAEVVKELCRQ